MGSLSTVLTPSGTGVGSEISRMQRMIEAIPNNGFGFARRAFLLCLYNNYSIAWPTIPGFDNTVESFSVTMVDSGKSDSIELDVDNRDQRWTGSWKPKVGQDTIVANLFICHWTGTNKGGRNFPTGMYTVDSFSASGGSRGSKATIGGVSMPANSEFNSTQRTKTWEKVTLFGIVSEIAAENGLVPFTDGDDFQIDSVEQSEQTDSEFINSLCEDYGFKVKIYWNRIVVYDADRYEAEDAVKEVTPADCETWNYDEEAKGTYTGARLSYTDTDGNTVEILVGNAESTKDKTSSSSKKSTSSSTKKTIVVHSAAGLHGTTVESSSPGPNDPVEQKRILTVNAKVTSQAEGERIAIAKLNDANRSAVTLTITTLLDVEYNPGLNVNVTGFGAIDGKYAVQEVKHSIGTKSTTRAKLYKIPDKFS